VLVVGIGLIEMIIYSLLNLIFNMLIFLACVAPLAYLSLRIQKKDREENNSHKLCHKGQNEVRQEVAKRRT